MDPKEMRVLNNARNRPAQIHRNTRNDIVQHSDGKRAHSLRKFRHSRHAPMSGTSSPALGQRHSVDLTPSCITPRPKYFSPLETVVVWHPDGTSERISQQELELISPSTPAHIPASTCLVDFDKFKRYWNYRPPCNDDIYLTVDETEITNAQMYHMTCTSGDDCYLTDNMLDTCLSILGSNKNIQKSSIAIMSTLESQICAFPTNSGKDAYAHKYENTSIILMPINDAMGVPLAKEEEHQQLQKREGSHWMLLLFDRRHKNIYYYDSFPTADEAVQHRIRDISDQMLGLLGEDQSQGWDMRFQPHCPHQVYDNGCEDYGACGPFVWTMAKLCVEQVQRGAGEEIPDLTREFQEQFARHWNSAEARMAMRGSVEDVRKARDFRCWVQRHGTRGSAEEGDMQVGQGVSVFESGQTHASLALEDGFESNIEGSIAAVDSDDTLNDEDPCPEHAECPAEEVQSTTKVRNQDEVFTIRCIGYDASVAERAQKAAEDEG